MKSRVAIESRQWSPKSPPLSFPPRDYHEAMGAKKNTEIENFEQFLSGIDEGEFQDFAIAGDGGNVCFVESDEELNDDDYNLDESDDDFTETIAQMKGKEKKGRPKKTGSNMPLDFGILVPEVTDKYDSDFASSEELKDTNVQSDREDGEEEVTYVEYNEEKDKDNPSLELGMKFKSLEQFKDACKNWGIKNRHQVWFLTNDKKRVICTCYQEYLRKKNQKYKEKQKKQKPQKKKSKMKKDDGCPFWVYASAVSKVDPTIQIKSINLTHTDGNVFGNFHMDSEWLAKKYVDTFRADPEWSLNGLIKRVQDDYNYTISRPKAWRAKDLCRKWIFGEAGSQYTKLLSYRAELLESNPGSTVTIWRDEGKFRGFYVCLSALKEAFKSGCRPIIGLDGCWLKGQYGGNLLSAVAIDPNDCIFPIAYAVIVENESRDTWSWFLTNLGEDLEINNSHHIAFMSDRQKGLIGAARDLFPNAEHRNCVRHMYQNFRIKHKGKELKDMVWNAASASNEVTFKKCMQKLKNEDKAAREWFNHPDRPFNTWTRSMFWTNMKCDMLTNNLCESFNRYILDSREKAIITMLEMIKNQLMRRMCKKNEWIDRYQGFICPKDCTQTTVEVAEVATDFGVFEANDFATFEAVSGSFGSDAVMKRFGGAGAAVHVSKRGRNVKRKIMSDYVTSVLEKKSRTSKK